MVQPNPSMLVQRKDFNPTQTPPIKIDMNHVIKPTHYMHEAQGQSGETTKEADRSSHARKADVEVLLVSDKPFDPLGEIPGKP